MRERIGIGGIVLLPVVCCLGLPVLVAAGLGIAVLVWGSVVLGALLLLGVAAYVFARRRRLRASRPRSPVADAPRAEGGG